METNSLVLSEQAARMLLVFREDAAGRIPRAQLHRRMKLSSGRLQSVLDELAERGLVERHVMVNRTRGPNPRYYHLTHAGRVAPFEVE